MDIEALVIQAHQSGARTRREIAVATGLDASMVDLAVDLLIRTGKLTTANLKMPCTTTSCGSCGENQACTPRQGIVPLTLGPTRSASSVG